MIRFYYHPTPNPAKVALFLEETGLPYEIVPVDTAKVSSMRPSFARSTRTARCRPSSTLTGRAARKLGSSNSTAILLYLGEKTGKLMGSPADRGEWLSWLFFIATGFGPFSGQAVHFQRAAPEKLPYAINRYRREAERHYTVLDQHLAGREFIVGNEYTITDISSGAGSTALFRARPAATTRSPPIPISAAGSGRSTRGPRLPGHGLSAALTPSRKRSTTRRGAVPVQLPAGGRLRQASRPRRALKRRHHHGGSPAMSDPVPAIAEASATGAVAELFADIRLVLGVEVVNLIWRHLATIPDALPWAWGMLRPLYADGTIAAEAQAFHGRLALPRIPPFRPAFFPRSSWMMATFVRSATSSPPMIAPTRWRSSHCRRCFAAWRDSLRQPSR